MWEFTKIAIQIDGCFDIALQQINQVSCVGLLLRRILKMDECVWIVNMADEIRSKWLYLMMRCG